MTNNGDTPLEPKVLICKECNEEFVFTTDAQQYFAQRGLTGDPKRCKSCHTSFKKQQREQPQRSVANQR